MHFHKHKDVFVPLTTPVTSGKVMGEYKLVAYDKFSGKVVYESPWKQNLITNWGLVDMGKNSWASYIAVGTSNTPPLITDTWLGNALAVESIGPNSGAPSTTYWSDLVYPNLRTIATMAARFDETVVGVIRELGIADSNNINPASNNLSTHALVDPEYNKTSSQILDVFYRVTRYWDNLHDLNVTGQIVLEGLTYDYIINGYRTQAPGNDYWNPTSSNAPYFRIYGSSEPLVEPKTTSISSGNIQSPAYSSSSYMDATTRVGDMAYIDNYYTIDLNDVNNSQALPNGIRTIWGLLNSSNPPGYQIQFTDVLNGWGIQKDRTKRLYLTIRNSWERL